jgi:hypothetical protein
MPEAGYTFLPWCRQGIVAELSMPDTGQPLDPQSAVRVGVTITGAGSGGIDVAVLGPGDVTGIDPRLVVRTEPRPGTTAFESNHLAAIDLDLPDLPWMLTPAAPGGNLLRPWIALVAVEQQEGVRVGVEAGSPLPVLRIESPADARTELPDPADLTLWVHAQLLADATIGAEAVPGELAARPEANVSRLVCPRRLRAGARYFACVVPTFDVGARRGLGGPPPDGAAMQPAWGSTRSVRIPVYFHWEFATGPEGDFETLAARLRPHASSARVGRAPMHVGKAQPSVVELPEGDPEAIVDMDGALRAPAGNDLRLGEIDLRIRSGLLDAVNAASRTMYGSEEALAVGPPLYGGFHANRHAVTGDVPEWLRELNIDPRPRVAAGLGAEIVRRNQEDLMHAAWVQLGDIRKANDTLNAIRLSLEAARKLHACHLVSLPAEGLVALAAPIGRRTLVTTPGGKVTLPAAIHPTSLPDATTSPALRRLASPRRLLLRAVARRNGATFAPAVLRKLARGSDEVDPTRFVADGLVRMSSLGSLRILADPDAPVDLSPLGIAGSLPARRVMQQVDLAGRLSSMRTTRVDVRIRPTASTVGLTGAAQVAAIAGIPDVGGDERADLLRELPAIAATKPRAGGFVVTSQEGEPARIDVLDALSDGTITLRTEPASPNVVVGRVDAQLLSSPGALPPLVEPLPTGPTEPIRVVPPLVSDPAVLARFRDAFAATRTRLRLDATPVVPTIVPFNLGAAAAALRRETNPDRTIPSRAATIVRIAGEDFRKPVSGISVAPSQDRVMAYPTFEVPSYLYLASYDRTRFCPGIDEIPPDSVTLLETNPRFVEAFLVGLNHEMNRELLWRTYPTDQRGTPFQRFWDRMDGQPDTDPIHKYGPGRLGSHLLDAEPKLVLLVRGELLRRYPTASVYAVRATDEGRLSTTPEDTRHPIFEGSFEPDVTFVGFDLADHELDEGNGWLFVIQEQPTEPRFGLDDPPSRSGLAPASWQEAAWSDTGVASGEHLTPAAIDAVGLGPLPHGGAVAAALFQRPVRVAVHGRHLVGGGT